jgi:hypothetical protein
LRTNPDERLESAFEGKNLAQIQHINVGSLSLGRMTEQDVLDLLTLQYFIKAVPVSI